MKRISLLICLLFIVLIFGCEFGEKFRGFYASESGDAFEFRSKSECVYHFENGSRQVCTYSIKNGIIEVVNSFGYIVPLKIIDNNTLERQDLSNKDLYRKR